METIRLTPENCKDMRISINVFSNNPSIADDVQNFDGYLSLHGITTKNIKEIAKQTGLELKRRDNVMNNTYYYKISFKGITFYSNDIKNNKKENE